MTNKEAVLGFTKASDNNDFATVSKLFGKEHQFHSSMNPVPMDTEQDLGLMHAFRNGFTNAKHEIDDIFESDNKVVVRGTWYSTHTGEFNKIPTSGKPIHLTFIMIVEVENNEMKNQWIEMDAMSLMMQIGAISVPVNAN